MSWLRRLWEAFQWSQAGDMYMPPTKQPITQREHDEIEASPVRQEAYGTDGTIIEGEASELK